MTMQYFIDNFLPWQREAKFAQVSDILIVPSVVPIKRTNHIDCVFVKLSTNQRPRVRSYLYRLHESEIGD